MKTQFVVTWEIDIIGDNMSPHDAAKQAWEHMRREDSTACVFKVFDEAGNETQIDLMEEV